MRKKILCLLLAGTLPLAAGCSGRGTAVSVEGATSMAQVMAVLQEVYHSQNPDVRVNVSGTGSGAGIAAALSGVCEIGLSSRELTEAEVLRGGESTLIALDGIAVIVHPTNSVTELNMEELAGIFTGEITNWAQLGGEERPIAAYGREAGSGTRVAFEEAVGIRDLCACTNEYCSTGDVAGNVAGNPNGIGYVSLAAVGEDITAVTLEGIPCTAETVRNGSYPICGPMLLVTRRGSARSDAAQAFLRFASSPEAKPYIALAGAVPPGGRED